MSTSLNLLCLPKKIDRANEETKRIGSSQIGKRKKKTQKQRLREEHNKYSTRNKFSLTEPSLYVDIKKYALAFETLFKQYQLYLLRIDENSIVSGRTKKTYLTQYKFWKTSIDKMVKIRNYHGNWNYLVMVTHSYILLKRVFANCMSQRILKKPSMEKFFQLFIVCLFLSSKLLYDKEEEIIDLNFEMARIFMDELFDVRELELELLCGFLRFENLFIHHQDFMYELESIRLLF
jgi:hypothetical protein